jgi:hypothetical protein
VSVVLCDLMASPHSLERIRPLECIKEGNSVRCAYQVRRTYQIGDVQMLNWFMGEFLPHSEYNAASNNSSSVSRLPQRC